MPACEHHTKQMEITYRKTYHTHTDIHHAEHMEHKPQHLPETYTKKHLLCYVHACRASAVLLWLLCCTIYNQQTMNEHIQTIKQQTNEQQLIRRAFSPGRVRSCMSGCVGVVRVIPRARGAPGGHGRRKLLTLPLPRVDRCRAFQERPWRPVRPTGFWALFSRSPHKVSLA